MIHRHHIIPRHAGGTDDPANLVNLTVPEHAEAHRMLWEQHGKLADKWAWLFLSQQTNDSNYTELCRQRMLGNTHLSGHIHSSETKAKMSATRRGRVSHRKGKSLATTHREHLSFAHLGKPSGMLGKHHTSETKEKQRRAYQGKHWRLENGKRVWYGA